MSLTGTTLCPCGSLGLSSRKWRMQRVWTLTWRMTSSPSQTLVSPITPCSVICGCCETTQSKTTSVRHLTGSQISWINAFRINACVQGQFLPFCILHKQKMSHDYSTLFSNNMYYNIFLLVVIQKMKHVRTFFKGIF